MMPRPTVLSTACTTETYSLPCKAAFHTLRRVAVDSYLVRPQCSVQHASARVGGNLRRLL